MAYGPRFTFQKPRFFADEEVILYSQGGYKRYPRSGWKLGHYYLTNKRLIFSQPAGIFEVPLDSITAITIEKRKFVLRTKDTMCMSYMDVKTQRSSKILVIMNNMETWRRRIFELSLLRIDQESVDRISRELDEESKMILWYLWENRHARIDELAHLISASTHMDILFKIREVINPIAKKLTGNPILSFERLKIDPETGEKILFSWWLVGRRKPEKTQKEIHWDVFDEGNHIDVVMELPGLKENSLLLDINGNRLTIQARTSDGKYQEEIPLPRRVHHNRYTSKYKNGVLLINLT